jgi:hypothetical protein
VAQEKMNEKIRTMAVFENSGIKPIVFEWNGHNHKVKKINLAYQEREGRSVNYYFGIETTTDEVFRLKYNDQKLTWTLEEHWVDG